MKRIVLAAAGLLLGLTTFSYADARGETTVQKVAINDGDTYNGIAVSLSSTAWTALWSADDDMRSQVITTTSTAHVGICIGTHTAAAVPCGDTTLGDELKNGVELKFNTEVALYGRIRTHTGAAAGAAVIKGRYTKDSRD